MIKHIWFDFSNTIAEINREAHNKLRYETYAEVVGKSVSPELVAEFENLYEKFEHSNSAVFESLGLPAGYWSKKVHSVGAGQFYSLMKPNIPQILENLSAQVPISIFSNLDVGDILPGIGINPKIFTHILSSGMVGKPKPALDGFYKIVELSKLNPDEILFVGDHVGKEILPAQKVGLQTGLMWLHADEADYCFTDFSEILNILK